MSEAAGAHDAHRALEIGSRFAVTGSSGFVGRHLVAMLLKSGRTVRCVSRQAAAASGAEHVQLANYTESAALLSAFEGCDAVVHLAARAHVLSESDASPEGAFRTANLETALAVARACVEAGVRRLVLLSSIGVNGNRTASRAFTAEDRPEPSEPYAVSKWQAEQAVTAALAGTGTSLVILRPTLVYGADCPGNFQLLLRWVHRLPVVPFGGLRQPRSLIHVDNLCSAILHAAEHEAAAGRTFLLSDGVDLSVAEVVAILANGFGKPRSRIWSIPLALLELLANAVGKRRALDKLAAALVVDSRAFTTATGWRAPRAPAEALAMTARDYRSAHTP
jgi:UDP-4-keto-D-FucNAc 4-reductase